MTQVPSPHRLDVRAFALAGGGLEGSEALEQFARVEEASTGDHGTSQVRWAARGEVRDDHSAEPQYWLHLQAHAELALICQRCLGPLHLPVVVDRWFRFVADETTATAQDEICEEDILVLAPDFNLHALIEDELLLELPYIPRHESCPVQGPMSVADPGIAEPAPRPNPFAALAGLKAAGGKSSG